MNISQTSIQDYPINFKTYKEKPLVWDYLGTILSTASHIFDSKKQNLVEPNCAKGHFLFGSYPEFIEHKYDLIKFLASYYDTYGKESRICKLYLGNRTFYIVTDPAYIKQILSKPESFIRGESLRIWQDKFSKGGLSEGKDTKKWRIQAKNSIGSSTLSTYYPRMIGVSVDWIQKRLSIYSKEKRSFDLFDETERVALATMGITLFTNDPQVNKNPFGLENENTETCTKFLHAFHSIFNDLSTRMTSALSNIPFIGNTLYSYLYPKEEKTMTEAKQTLKSILLPIFKETIEGEIDKNSHLQHLLDIFEIDAKNPNYSQLLDLSLGFLQASFETSSKALGWTLYVLARDQKLQGELRETIQSNFGNIMPSTQKEFKECLKKIPLLSQIMEEALRLFPPFPILVRDVQEPTDFPEYNLKKGATIIIAPYLAHREETNWKDPNNFDPKRFTTSDEPKNDMLGDIWQKKHYNYLPFIKGNHECPGQWFGKQELLINVLKFIMTYKIKLEDPNAKRVEEKFCITLQPKEPIKVKIKPI